MFYMDNKMILPKAVVEALKLDNLMKTHDTINAEPLVVGSFSLELFDC